MATLAKEFYDEIRNAVEVFADMDSDDLALWLRIMGAMVACGAVDVERGDLTIEWMRDHAPRALEIAEPYIIWI